MKRPLPVVLSLLMLLSSCLGDAPYTKGKLPASPRYLITPGKSVGAIKIGAPRDSVFRLLGNPNRSDTGAQDILDTWFLGKDSSIDFVSVCYKQRDTSVKKVSVSSIRVTDTNYRTQEGVGAGDSLINLSRVFIVRPSDVFKSTGIKYISYGTQRGMTFVINPKGVCNSVIIYNPKLDIDSGAYLPYFGK